jgi:hypothetical protein
MMTENLDDDKIHSNDPVVILSQQVSNNINADHSQNLKQPNGLEQQPEQEHQHVNNKYLNYYGHLIETKMNASHVIRRRNNDVNDDECCLVDQVMIPSEHSIETKINESNVLLHCHDDRSDVMIPILNEHGKGNKKVIRDMNL